MGFVFGSFCLALSGEQAIILVAVCLACKWLRTSAKKGERINGRRRWTRFFLVRVEESFWLCICVCFCLAEQNLLIPDGLEWEASLTAKPLSRCDQLQKGGHLLISSGCSLSHSTVSWLASNQFYLASRSALVQSSTRQTIVSLSWHFCFSFRTFSPLFNQADRTRRVMKRSANK